MTRADRERAEAQLPATVEQQAALQAWQDGELQRRFLTCYRHLGLITAAAEAANINQATVHHWCKSVDGFEQAMREAELTFTESLELKGLDALRGATADQLIAHPNLYFFHMKKRDPRFRDNVTVVNDNRSITVNHLSPEQAAAVARALTGTPDDEEPA